MLTKKFDEWVSKCPDLAGDKALILALKKALSLYNPKPAEGTKTVPTADQILIEAVKDPAKIWSPLTVAKLLESFGKVDISAIEDLIKAKQAAQASDPAPEKKVAVVAPPLSQSAADLLSVKAPAVSEQKLSVPVPVEEGADAGPNADDVVVLTSASGQKRTPRMIRPGATKLDGADGADSEPDSKTEGGEPEKKGLLGGFSNPLRKKKEGGGSSLRSARSSRFSGGGGGGDNPIGGFFQKQWQAVVIILIAIGGFAFINFLGPANFSNGSGEVIAKSFSLSSFPLVVLFTIIILFAGYLESNDRGDTSDFWFVIVAIAMTFLAIKYKASIIQLTVPGWELGWMVLGLLLLGPYLLIYVAVKVNRARNIFAAARFSKIDLTPMYMTFLLFWALARVSEHWIFVPNPCILPDSFYLAAGLAGLAFELSGNWINLAIAVLGGIGAGLLIFNPNPMVFVWAYLIYMGAMIYGFGEWATKQGTINMESSKSEGGIGLGANVKTKRFVPYDMFLGMLWFTLITVVLYNGNPAFPIVSPF